jgi:succinate dehydrogenase / fumarate reductase flavoprotein subunit
MQGLADGYFVLPYTIGDYLAGVIPSNGDTSAGEFSEAVVSARETTEKLLSINGKRTVDDFHKELGQVMWNNCGMARTEKGLNEALKRIPEIREEFWKNVTVTGSSGEFNQALERAGRVADFLEYGELMVCDALERKESCGGHFREESQTDEGEAKRDDKNFSHVAAWEFKGINKKPKLHKEKLIFENVKLIQRSYK